MAAPDATSLARPDPQKLAEAFRLFNEVSEELAASYHALERRVEALTKELAAANAEAERLRREAERNERLRAMGEMVARLAHQLRTPLAAALLYAGNLENPELPQAARLAIARKTVERLKHLERLIQDMLLFARGEVLGREKMSTSCVFAELAQTFEPLAASRGVQLLFRETTPVEFIGDRKAIVGALANLIENALSATPQGGRVEAWVEVDEERIRFGVRDTGAGMGPEVLERLFEPFFTTRSEGTGLGLAIARAVARAHGGGIEAQSAPGEGSTFVFSLARRLESVGS
ncbi:MAG: HAMP domain-containing histidine kinase [Rhodocyclaceae bacterium]|nr:HAMP domain-containing histidine kinase [Rhodocyclaceae bacterium]